MTRYCLTRESETVCQPYVLKKKQRKNKLTLFAAEQDGAEQYKKRRPEENPLHQMQAGKCASLYLQRSDITGTDLCQHAMDNGSSDSPL
ncbi:hypothetical protein NDU88_002494 [Pleurodeles waltl]|uniref:Uncharacterized protein n=1 Tax=Pleurodeles waltl TaxID=8319 RepID=A0AAV7M2M0_PLEWA|nr:hypothetical protein NDU88_002494 [Pleurodeles waltl]